MPYLDWMLLDPDLQLINGTKNRSHRFVLTADHFLKAIYQLFSHKEISLTHLLISLCDNGKLLSQRTF